MAEQQQRFSLITDKSLADLRKLVGVPIEDSLEPWCYEATRDNIRHWAHGIGDDNPLWCEPQYAANTHTHTAAPPSFIFALNRSFSGYVGGLPGVHAMFAGIDAVWHRSMLLDDQFTTKAWLKEIGRASDPLRRARDPADLPLRILQSARRVGLRGR